MIERTIHSNSFNRTASGSTTFASSGNNIVRQTTSGTSTYYIYDAQGNVQGEHIGSTSYYYLHNNISSIVAVIGSTGTVSDRYAYDPYGNVTASSGSVANPWQFAGGYYDASTGLTKFGDRYYESNSGRWTQADTLAGNITDPQSLNRFVYAADDPVNLIDPSGADAWGAIVNFVEHKAISCFGDVVVGIGGGLVTVVGTVVGATVIGFWPGIGLIVLGTAGIAYGAAGVANGGC